MAHTYILERELVSTHVHEGGVRSTSLQVFFFLRARDSFSMAVRPRLIFCAVSVARVPILTDSAIWPWLSRAPVLASAVERCRPWIQHAGLLDAIERNRTEQNTTILSRAKHNRAVLYYTILYCTVLYCTIILCYVKKKVVRAVSAYAKHNRAVLYYTILYSTVLYIILWYVKKKLKKR